MIYSIIGLGFDIAGVILLFMFGILPDNILDKIVTHKLDLKEVKKNIRWSKIGLILLVMGFIFQIVGTIIDSNL